ncbi:MAG: sigma-70 family RNA polymerase sigma factor [Myxococcales bacterium]|nr:sigma-70 family RNA polymerase sigma factor [Myxococcales bacterium]
MEPAGRAALDEEVRRRVQGGDLHGATTAALGGYGQEVFGFLVGLVGRREAADEVFARFAEQTWRGLAEFGWQCSLRTWLYGVARHAAYNHMRDERRRARRQKPLPEGSQLSAIVAEAREKTRSYFATDFKDRFAKLRESLPTEDRELLVLRVDRGLEWEELARVLSDASDDLDAATLKREASRLRKRFQLLKKKLLELGRKEGLVPDRSER